MLGNFVDEPIAPHLGGLAGLADRHFEGRVELLAGADVRNGAIAGERIGGFHVEIEGFRGFIEGLAAGDELGQILRLRLSPHRAIFPRW